MAIYRTGRFSGISRQRFFAWYATIILLLAACASDSSKQDNVLLARKKYTEALQAASISSPAETTARLSEAARLNPDEPSYRLALGMNHFAAGNLAAAETELQEAVRLDKNSGEAYKQLGRLYMKKGDLDKAAYYLEASMEKHAPGPPQQILNWIALCYYGQKKYALAETEWLKAIRIKDSEALRLNMALSYLDSEQFAKAMDSLKQALAVNSKYAPAHYHLALLYLKNKNLELAASHFNQVIQLDPSSQQAKSSQEYLSLLARGK